MLYDVKTIYFFHILTIYVYMPINIMQIQKNHWMKKDILIYFKLILFLTNNSIFFIIVLTLTCVLNTSK